MNGGKDPFKPDIENLGKSKYPLRGLIGHYANLQTGKSVRAYLMESEYKTNQNPGTVGGWFYSSSSFPPHSLKAIVDDLQIP